jgi:hypothetical protein
LVGVLQDSCGNSDNEDEAKDIEYDVTCVFAPEIETGYEKVEVGVEDAEDEQIGDDVALGRRIG